VKLGDNNLSCPSLNSKQGSCKAKVKFTNALFASEALSLNHLYLLLVNNRVPMDPTPPSVSLLKLITLSQSVCFFKSMQRIKNSNNNDNNCIGVFFIFFFMLEFRF